MAGNPSKDYVRQPGPRGTPGDMANPQDLMNQSWDSTGRTFITQLMGTPDGTNFYKLKVNADGSLNSTGGGGSGGAVAGDVANDAVDSGNPVKVGGKANSSAPTPVAAGDRTDAWHDLFGRQAVSDIDPELNQYTGLTSLRDKLVSQRYTILADSVADGLATFWTTTSANGGTAVVSGGEGVIQTSTDPAGSIQISSTAPAYFPGQVSWFNSAIRLGDTGSTGNIRRWGVFTVSGTTPQDGFYYELNDTIFNAVSVKLGVATAVPVASWSRATAAPFTLNTSYHSFEIRWTANTCYFYVDNVLRHQATGGTTAITSTLNFPMTLQSINSSGATNRFLAVRNCGIGRFGTPEVQPVLAPISKKLIDNTTTTNVTYIGEAPLGTSTSAAGWRIKRISEVSSPISITYTGSGYGAIWDNRVGLSYS